MTARLGWRIALALVVVLLGGAAARAGDEGWLLGRWELIRDPDGSPKDWLEFAADGRMVAIKSGGQRFSGRYVVSDTTVHLNYKVGSQSVLITLTHDADRKELFARSAQTGNTAVYEKRQ